MAEHYRVYFNFSSSGGKYGSLQITFDSERRCKKSGNCTQVYFEVLSSIYELGNRYQVNLKVKKPSEDFNEVWFVFGDAGTGSKEGFLCKLAETIMEIFEKNLANLSDNPVAVDVRAWIARDFDWIFESQRERKEEKKKEKKLRDAVIPEWKTYVARCPYCRGEQTIRAFSITDEGVYCYMPSHWRENGLGFGDSTWVQHSGEKIKIKYRGISKMGPKIKEYKSECSRCAFELKLEFLDLSMKGPYFLTLGKHSSEESVCQGSHLAVELVPLVEPISEKQLEVKSGLWGIEEIYSLGVWERCKKCSSKTSGELFILTGSTGEQTLCFKGKRCICLVEENRGIQNAIIEVLNAVDPFFVWREFSMRVKGN